jgi:hypothetical protein
MSLKLTAESLRALPLARQGLLKPAPLLEVARVALWPYDDPTCAYLSLGARAEGFTWEAFHQARYVRQTLGALYGPQGMAVLSAPDWQEAVRTLYAPAPNAPLPEFADFNLSLDVASEVRFYLLEALETASDSLTLAELKRSIPPRLTQTLRHAKTGVETSIVSLVLRWMWACGQIGWGTGVGHWRSRDEDYFLTPKNSVPLPTRPEAATFLARWYFQTYAPAAYEDWVGWCALPLELARSAFEETLPNLTPCQGEGLPHTLYLWAGVMENVGAKGMGALLPADDPLLMAYPATRARFYDEEGLAADLAFSHDGRSLPTLWLDGRIVGLWTWVKKRDEPMTLEPFVQPTRHFRKQLGPPAERVKTLVEASHLLWTM